MKLAKKHQVMNTQLHLQKLNLCADSEQVICLYMVKPYKPNDVDGFKKVQVPPVQPMPQAIQQSQVSVEVDKEMDDDLPPF